VESHRPHLVEAGLFLLIVAMPVALFPLAVQQFSDLKLILLLLGTTFLWASGAPVSPRLLWPATAWAAAACLATALGTDPLASILGPWEGTGLLLLLACGALVLVAPSLTDAQTDRARTLLVASAAVLAAIPLLWGTARSLFDLANLDTTFWGSTIGNPVLLAIFLAAAIPAVVAHASTRTAVAVAVVLGAAFAANGERSALILPVVAVYLSLWLMPSRRRRALVVVAVLLASGVAWTVLRPEASGLRATEAQFTTVAGERARVEALTANVRAFTHRPVLGWGPGLAWNGFVSSASGEELRIATRGWRDVHNLPLQMFVTTGVVGGVAFLFLAALLGIGVARAPLERRWLAASAIVLFLGSLYEPTCLSLTPLLFLFAAAAYPEPPAQPVARRWLRPAGTAILVTGTLVAAVALTASALEQWGRTHFAEWSIRAAVAIQPGRLSAQERLAIELALDGRAGDEAAAAEARSVIAHAVEQHPWDPNVRLVASDVERLLKDFDASEAWIVRHHEVFPNDDLSKSYDDETPLSGG
jgi:O-antigen ligase